MLTLLACLLSSSDGRLRWKYSSRAKKFWVCFCTCLDESWVQADAQGVLQWYFGGRKDCSAKVAVVRVTPWRLVLHVSEAVLDFSLIFLTFFPWKTTRWAHQQNPSHLQRHNLHLPPLKLTVSRSDLSVTPGPLSQESGAIHFMPVLVQHWVTQNPCLQQAVTHQRLLRSTSSGLGCCWKSCNSRMCARQGCWGTASRVGLKIVFITWRHKRSV